MIEIILHFYLAKPPFILADRRENAGCEILPDGIRGCRFIEENQSA